MTNITKKTKDKNRNKIFTATTFALPLTNYTPCGELYQDFYIVPKVDSDGKEKIQLVETHRFYIREYNNFNEVYYTDYLIDPETLVEITKEQSVIQHCDLATDTAVTYNNGEYECNK